MRERPHPEQGYRSAMGIIALAQRYERIRAAYRQLAEQDDAADLSRDERLGLMLDRETAMRATGV